MAYFFFDDSKHPEFGFAIGVFAVFEEDPTERVADLMIDCGLMPFDDEFKSSNKMLGDAVRQGLRVGLRGILEDSKLGLCIVSNECELGRNASLLLQKMLRHPYLASSEHQVFVDEGIYHRRADQAYMCSIPEASRCKFNFEVDSKKVLGIQLADLAAHTCGLMMKDALGLVSKCLPAGENSGYDPEMPVELGFSMWASLRHNFLALPDPNVDWERDSYEKIRTVHTEECGLVLDSTLSPSLKEAAKGRFGSHWLGCIH